MSKPYLDRVTIDDTGRTYRFVGNNGEQIEAFDAKCLQDPNAGIEKIEMRCADSAGTMLHDAVVLSQSVSTISAEVENLMKGLPAEFKEALKDIDEAKWHGINCVARFTRRDYRIAALESVCDKEKKGENATLLVHPDASFEFSFVTSANIMVQVKHDKSATPSACQKSMMDMSGPIKEMIRSLGLIAMQLF